MNLFNYSERSKAYRVYNFEIQCVKEPMPNKFDDKESEFEVPEQVESFADIQVSEEHSEPDQTPESEESPEAETISETQDEEASIEAQDGSQQATQFRNTFIGNIFRNKKR